MLILAGLGNPGGAYAGHRHNIGFRAVDAIARRHDAGPWRARFQGLATEAVISGEKVLLLKPMTYMNDSGRSIGEAMRFFKLEPASVVVLHDELDLPEARLKMKTGGGNAGHNGLRSTTACIGNDYRRIRLGIGHPGDKALVHAWVLSDFAKSERAWVEDICAAIAENAELIVKSDDSGFQNKVHLFMAARGHDAAKS
jgi:peptidyl-tRNA hydrolase, PTH1 family